MACGSGAFLVQACRYLSALLVEAWEQAEVEYPDVPGITPEGAASTGATDELLIPKETEERLVYARRIIAQRCLYGVDKNPLAAEMGKLSLWLLTLAKDKPFTFLDHAIRSGDSLVGIKDLDQLRVFNLNPETDERGLFTGPIFDLIDEAVALRKKIEANPSNTVEDVEAQKTLLAEAEEKTARLRYAADLLLSVEFQPVNSKEKEDLHSSMAIQAGHYASNGAIEEFRVAAKKAMNSQPTFHWPLEFPEVMLDRGGFDAFICNPPFMVAFRMSPEFGERYTAYLKLRWSHRRGRADLSAYFLLTAASLLKPDGNTGIITTKTISQEDNRKLCLEYLCDNGYAVYRAFPHLIWSGAAAVHVAITHLHKGKWQGLFTLDNEIVDRIGPDLTAGDTKKEPFQLKNLPCEPSKGINPSGKGFIITLQEADEMISADPKNREVIHPFLNGAELNSSPALIGKRYIIDFQDWPLEKAERYVLPWKRIVETVAPQRTQGRLQVHEKDFWKFEDKRPELRKQLSTVTRAIAFSEVSKHFAFAFLLSDVVFSPSLRVVPTDDAAVFGVLQSSIHLSWAHEYQYTLKGDPRYSIGTCFRTFPFPLCDAEHSADMREKAEFYHKERSTVMTNRNVGLRKVYDAFYDSDETAEDIQKLRDLHVEMDYAVAAAYGWTDLELGHGFHETKQGVRFTISEEARREVLDRLLKLNHERYAEEVKQGLHDKKSKAKKSGAKRSRRSSTSSAVPTLFD